MRHTTKLIRSLLTDKKYSSRRGTAEVEELFGAKLFSFPKPLSLIQDFVKAGSNDGDIIMDFFGGSGTTAHAVLKTNAEESTERKFIVVQLPEKLNVTNESLIDSKGVKYQNLSELAISRIKYASQVISNETGASIDYGFRVFRLDESNMQDVYYRPTDYSQTNLELFADNVKPDRTPEDLLVQVMLDWGLSLSLKIVTKTVTNKQVFIVADNSLIACFDKEIDEAFAKEIAILQPLRIVFRDNSFKDDTAKSNVKQLLKQLSPNTEMKVI